MYFGTGPFSLVEGPSRPRLEILQALPLTASDKPPVLFLHGAFSGAWVWAEHFLGHLARAGYAAYAVSFRGHGDSAGRGGLWDHGIGDYVDDARAAIGAIGRAPVLVGHSLGGMIAQLCLGRQALAGLVLMAAVPFEGLIPSHAQLAMRDPALWLELMSLPSFGPLTMASISPRLRRALLADELPRPTAERHIARMQHSSLRAIAELQLPRYCESAGSLGVPALVIGREDDRLIPLDAMQRTAWLHRAELRLLPGCAHMTMLEARWRDSADALAGWLDRSFG